MNGIRYEPPGKSSQARIGARTPIRCEVLTNSAGLITASTTDRTSALKPLAGRK
jgi:hypothetical protein